MQQISNLEPSATAGADILISFFVRFLTESSSRIEGEHLAAWVHEEIRDSENGIVPKSLLALHR